MKKILMILMILVLAGCSNFTFLKSNNNHNFNYYIFIITVPSTLLLSSEISEASRIKRIEKQLTQLGFSLDYEIVSKQVKIVGNGLIGEVYKIYYEIKIPKKEFILSP